MQYAVSRVIVQRLCDDRAELVPYLTRVIDSLERHGGLYHAELAKVVPVDVIEELNEWLSNCAKGLPADQLANRAIADRMEADLEFLEHLFCEPNDRLNRPDTKHGKQK